MNFMSFFNRFIALSQIHFRKIKCPIFSILNAENRAFDLAEMNLAQSDEAIKKAHEIHTSLLVEEARDPGCIPASMMLIHASNHLSGAELTNELAKRFVRVYQTR